mmetsp:Transcript_14173/g.32468  ORF Transcript_14173/g.32468 Transcript_14173/m.32468 type:complete len:206 (+) Transcript_14173:358-975(+)
MCLKAVFKHASSSRRLSAEPANTRNFFICDKAPTKFEKQKNFKPNWIVPAPARFPPGKIFHCFMWPMWSTIMNVASDAFWSKSSTRSTGSLMLRLFGKLWITGSSLHQRWVRRAPASCTMAVRACPSRRLNLDPAFGAARLAKPTKARAEYWKRRANLSLPSALPHKTLKLSIDISAMLREEGRFGSKSSLNDTSGRAQRDQITE